MTTPQYRIHLERLRKFREARVAEAAWHWNRQYPHNAREHCLTLGISHQEINEGFDLGEQMATERRINFAIHGDPAYGSWGVFGKPPVQPIRDLVLIWLQGPHCVACSGLADTGCACETVAADITLATSEELVEVR